MKKILLAVLVAVTGFTWAKADEGRLLRFPATNGSEVVFSYAGDLYKAPIEGGEAVRLTSHVGYEMFAKYSPDGRTIAFTGQYDGNTEVYSIPAEGGTPVRLTYTATNGRDDLGDRMGPNNIVMGWTPDGKNIVYRNRISDGFDGKLWTIPAAGGMSAELPLPEGGFCCYSPDGSKLAYNRTFREFRTWKYYRGGQADDIWIWDGASVKNITENDAQDIMPMWIGDEIYFISDRDHWMNIFVYDTVSGRTSKVTDFKEYDVKFPSTNGALIVFENAGYVYKLDPSTKKCSRIDISLNPEGVQARRESKLVSDNITSAGYSEKEDRFVVTARGEVFTVPAAQGVTRNITRTPGANDRGADYSPDGKYISYISDATGETEVCLYDVQTASTRQLTSGTDTYIRRIFWAPDSKSLIYSDRKNRLVSVSVPDGASKVVAVCPESEFRSVSFSPDSKWIAYTRPATNEMSVVYVRNLASGQEIAVTQKWYDSSSPVFSQDGKYLVYSSARDLNPTYSSVEWNYSYSNMSSMYLTLLSKDGKSPFLPSDGKIAEAEPAQKRADAPKGKKKSASDAAKKDDAPKAVADVVVDAEGLAERTVKLPVGTGYFSAQWADEKGVWYSSRGGSYYLDFEKGEAEKLLDGSMDVVGKKALVFNRRGNALSVIDLPRRKAEPGKPADLSRMYAEVDYSQEWPQIFDEVWRAFRDGFYLENMHGIDWNAMKAKYSVLLPYVQCRLDLNYVIGEMIGELTVGHSYVSPGEYVKAPRIDMGLLGADIVADGGAFRIAKILKGAPYSESLRSPLTEPGMDVAEGDYILAVDGVSVSGVSNFYSLMVGKAGALVELTLASSPSAAGRKVVVKPIADEYPLRHFEWVQKNIEYVEKASDGKIGYIYIPDMGPDGLNEFVRYYYPQLDKQALIVDDRANGGGNVSPMIIERLLREPYRLTMSRTSTMTGKIPEGTFYGPKVCLVNKYSASDGDLFPWSFKAVGLGEVIGMRTWGGIVGISGSLPYMDGTDVRVPFFTNYDNKTGEWIVENHGVDPDIVIDNDPVLEASGVDQQLDKAIEVLLKKLEDYKPLPGVPAPRDFSYKGE